MSRNRHICIPVAISQSPTPVSGIRRLDGCVRRELRCRKCGAEFVVLGFLRHLVLSALGLH